MVYISFPQPGVGKKVCKSEEFLLAKNIQGNFTTLKAAEICICKEPPDIAFIWLGEAELNAFRLAGEIKELNPLSKIIFIGSQKENAVEAFEYEADGFLLMPLSKKKIGQLLAQNIGVNRDEKPDKRIMTVE